MGSFFKACTMNEEITRPSLVSKRGPYVLKILATLIFKPYCREQSKNSVSAQRFPSS
jgi:hypothetical protein